MNLSESNANVDLLCQVFVVEAVVVFNRGAVTVSGLSRRGWWVTFVLVQRAKCKSKGHKESYRTKKQYSPHL